MKAYALDNWTEQINMTLQTHKVKEDAILVSGTKI
jgi:hypothetical protein